MKNNKTIESSPKLSNLPQWKELSGGKKIMSHEISQHHMQNIPKLFKL